MRRAGAYRAGQADIALARAMALGPVGPEQAGRALATL